VTLADGLAEVPALESPSAAAARRRQLLDEHEHGTSDRRPAEHEEENRKERKVVPGHSSPSYRLAERPALDPHYNDSVGVVAIVLIACAAVLVVGAEWPRLAGRRPARVPRRGRKRGRRQGGLRLVEGGERDDFAASVERDLENLPVLGEPDDRTRR
jgi:hypothetical protein